VNFHLPEFLKVILVTQQKTKLLPPVEALQAQVGLQVLLQVLLVNQLLHQRVLNLPLLLPLPPLRLLQNLQRSQLENRS
jgi:hypothetical protein